MTPLAVRTSQHIITVSEFSKREILRFYPFLKEQDITVIYNATDESLFRPLPEVEKPRERFALAVSSLDPRKNFSRLVEAFKGIEGCKLYIVGNANRVFGQQGSSGLESENVKVLGRVSDEELNRLYNQASCFIFPSIYEGFGLPPLEAMQCGCPVIVSDIPVVHEVCGDAAVYFNPFNVEDIRQTIKGFMADIATKRPSMVKKGFENTEKYSWVNSAKRLIELMK
jgi:glycosyltransferase involved in cell wall biosynthesis